MSFQSLPKDIQDEIFSYEYRLKFGLTVEEFEREPWEALYQAQVIWSQQAARQNDEASKSTFHDMGD